MRLTAVYLLYSRLELDERVEHGRQLPFFHSSRYYHSKGSCSLNYIPSCFFPAPGHVVKMMEQKNKNVIYNSRFTHSDFLLGMNLKPICDSDLSCLRSPQLQLCQTDCHSQNLGYTVEWQQDKLRWQSKEHNTCTCDATTTISDPRDPVDASGSSDEKYFHAG